MTTFIDYSIHLFSTTLCFYCCIFNSTTARNPLRDGRPPPHPFHRVWGVGTVGPLPLFLYPSRGWGGVWWPLPHLFQKNGWGVPPCLPIILNPLRRFGGWPSPHFMGRECGDGHHHPNSLRNRERLEGPTTPTSILHGKSLEAALHPLKDSGQ